MTIFRIDDVSVNTDQDRLCALIKVILDAVPNARIMVAVSPLVHRLDDAISRYAKRSTERERVFPRRLRALSDHRNFFKVDLAGVPSLESVRAICNPIVASHGLVHVDHRLLGYETQELSIVASCSLLKSAIFVPPFNTFDDDTQEICEEHLIDLVKFEDGWKHVGHNDFSREAAQSGTGKFYLHTYDVAPQWLREWFGNTPLERPSSEC